MLGSTTTTSEVTTMALDGVMTESVPPTLKAVPARPALSQGIVLTADEARLLQSLWRCDERVDWAAYDRLKARILALVL